MNAIYMYADETGDLNLSGAKGASADGAWSRLYGCTNGENYSFEVNANFTWRNSGTGNTDSQREKIYGSFAC